MTHDPWVDNRTTTHWSFCGNELYRAYNLLSDYDRENLLWEIDDELKQHDDKWIDVLKLLITWLEGSWFTCRLGDYSLS